MNAPHTTPWDFNRARKSLWAMRYQTIIYSEVPPARLRVADQLDNALNDSLTNGWRPISIDWGVGRSLVAVTYERLPAWEYTASRLRIVSKQWKKRSSPCERWGLRAGRRLAPVSQHWLLCRRLARG